jgi:formylglycine-generating enzyme required for sulfatase activity
MCSPQFPATIANFRIDPYEVTVGRFRRFVAEYSQTMTASGAGKNPSNPADTGWNTAWNSMLPTNATALAGAKGLLCDSAYQTWTSLAGSNENRPINCVNWYEAYAFCIWDGGRLPTEAEWEYLAAGGDCRQYPWGSSPAPASDANLAVYGCFYNGTGTCSGITNIAPVGSVAAGSSRWGQFDLAGNVWEWGGSNQIVVLRKCRVEWLWMGGNVSRVAEHGDFFVS